MIQINIILIILFWHWIADFVLQTDWQAQNKSKNIEALLQHTSVYSASWIIPGIVIFSDKYSNPKLFFVILFFVLTTWIIHSITDFFTSKLNTKLWNEKKIHWFFVSIGFDQFLHFTQLLLTFYFFNNIIK